MQERVLVIFAPISDYGKVLCRDFARFKIPTRLLTNFEELIAERGDPGSYLVTSTQALGASYDQFFNHLKTHAFKTPVIFLLENIDNIKDLYSRGVDACLPIHHVYEELDVQVRAIERRQNASNYANYSGGNPVELQVGDMVLNISDHSVRIKDRVISLSEKEYKILRVMHSAAGRILKREDIRDRISGLEKDKGAELHWEQTIARLRKKLGKRVGNYIKTEYGKGYALCPPDTSKRIIH